MISRKLYLRIIIHVVLIVVSSIALGLSAVKLHSVKYSIVCFAAIVLLAANMIRVLNRTNRNVKYFFDSVKNDDSNLSFSSLDKSTGINELNESMNRVNRQIQLLKIRNSQQEQYFQKILEQLATGIISYDNKGFIYNANSAAKNLLGSETLTHLQQLERIDSKLYTVIKNLKPFERRLVGISTEQGERQLSLKSTSFGSRENEMMILSVQDIKHELDEKEVDSWMKLIRVLMHEIMNSITPITSLSESLSGIYQKGETAVSPSEIDEQKISSTIKGLRVISEQGKGLMSFVESYRKLTRIPKPELKTVKINDIFSRVQILSGSLENTNKTKIIFKGNHPGLEILADENLICLVLINLIKNAIEANESNTDGVVTVSSGTDTKNNIEICVSDNGPGIPEENLDKIFVPFFTTRAKGSGIGLSLSRQIMRAHGGNLTVISEPGKETVFCMSFIITSA